MSVLNSSEIDSLPDEILFKILSYLDPIDLITCQNICQKWRNITNIPKLKMKCKFLQSNSMNFISKIYQCSKIN